MLKTFTAQSNGFISGLFIIRICITLKWTLKTIHASFYMHHQPFRHFQACCMKLWIFDSVKTVKMWMFFSKMKKKESAQCVCQCGMLKMDAWNMGQTYCKGLSLCRECNKSAGICFWEYLSAHGVMAGDRRSGFRIWKLLDMNRRSNSFYIYQHCAKFNYLVASEFPLCYCIHRLGAASHSMLDIFTVFCFWNEYGCDASKWLAHTQTKLNWHLIFKLMNGIMNSILWIMLADQSSFKLQLLHIFWYSFSVHFWRRTKNIYLCSLFLNFPMFVH